MGFLKGFLRKAEEEIADILPGGKTGKSIRAQRKAPVAKTVSRPRDESKSWLSKDFNPVSDGINDIKSAFKYASKDWKSSENQRQVDTQNANRQILKKYTQGQLNKNQVESLVGSKVKNAGLKKKGNLYVNTVKNSTGETLLQNTGAGIMNAAPQRVIGGLAEYGGTALGNDSIRDFGTRLNQPFRDYNALAYENADNKAVAIGGNIAGNLLTLPIAPAGKAGLAYRGVVAGAPTAADTGYAIKQAGGGRVAQTIGGGATGIASGYLNSVGGDKILKPVGAVTSKLVGKTVTTKLAPTAFGRIGAGVLNEGGEEVIEQGVDNAVAKSTYDPDRKLTENLATSFLLGGAMGGVVRGGVELGNPNTRTQLINESKVKDIANDQGGFVSGRNAKDFKQAEAEGKVFEGVDGKPRFEVDDSGMNLNTAKLKSIKLDDKIQGYKPVKLNEVLDHKKLYEQYPEFKDIEVQLDYLGKDINGSYNPDTKVLTLDSTMAKLDQEKTKETILHEITHKTQQVEGWATGGSLKSVFKDMKKRIEELRPEFNKQKNIYNNSVKKLETNFGNDIGSPDYVEVRNRLRQDYENNPAVKEYNDLYDKASKMQVKGEDVNYYKNLAGEAEARAVASRMNMTEGERYKMPDVSDTAYTRRENSQLNPMELSSLHPLNIQTMKAPNGVDLSQYSMGKGENFDHLSKNYEYDRDNKQLTTYRVVPNGISSVEPGDFVFDNKQSAIDYMAQYPKRGEKIISTKGNFDDFLSPAAVQSRSGTPKGMGELIYAPKKIQNTAKPQSTFNDSLDVPKEDLIIRDGSGKAMSVDPLESLKQEARKEYDFFSNSKYFADNDNVIKTLAELNDKSTPTYQALDLLRQERGLGGVEKNLIEISKRTDATNKQTAQAKQVAKKDLDGFTEGKSALQRGKIEKTLDSQIRYNGQVMSKRDYIRKLVNDGYVPDEKTGSIYSPNDRSNYQAVTKTEADYARHLYKDKTNSIESLKQEADSVRKVKQKWEQKFRQQAEKLSPEEANNLRTKMMKDAQKELSGYRTEDLIDADIKNARQSEIPDSTTSNKVKELLEKPVSKNDYDPNNVGYFLDLSSENIKDVTPLKGIEQYSDGMYVSTKAGTSEVKIQDWSDSGQGFRVSNGNGNEIARFNTNAEAVEFAKKALTIENEAKRQGKRVILSGSRVENRTQSQPPKTVAPVESKGVLEIRDRSGDNLISDPPKQLYRGGNKYNANSNKNRPKFFAEDSEYAGTYGDVSTKGTTPGKMFTIESDSSYNKLHPKLLGVIQKRYEHLGKNDPDYINVVNAVQRSGYNNHTLNGEKLSKQFSNEMPEVFKQAFDDLGIDYIRIPGEQFPGTVNKVGHQTEIIEIPKPKAPVEGKASNQGVSDRRKPVQDKVNRTEPKRTETAPKPTLQDALDGKSTKIEPKVVKTEPKIPKVAPKRTETAPKKPFIPDEIKAIRAKREANTSQQTRTDQTRKNQQALDSKSSVQSQPESKVAPRTGVQSISQAVQGRVNKISPQKARQGIGSKGRQGLLSGLSSKDTIQLSGVNVNDPFNNRKIGKRLKNEFGRYFVDEDAEMINLMKRIEKETGQKDLVETWLQDSDLVRNTNSIANSKIRRNENLKLALRGLSKKQQASFDEYASARTELSNLERGLESSSKPKEQLQQIVRDGNIDFGNRFIALNNYYGDWAKDLYDAGIISKSKLDDWSQNKDYVRVQRDMEDILNYTPPTGKSRSFGTTSTSKKRTGSTREILSPTNIALERGQQLQLEIQRNKAASNTIDTLEKYGLAEKVSQQYATGKNVVKRFKDGKVEYFATSKDVKRVIENVNPFQLGVLGRVISTPTRLFRSGTTALSAPFATTNYVRDQISSAIYSDQALPRLSKTAQGNVEYIAGTHSPKNIVSGIASATKDYFGGSSNPLWEKFEQVAGDQTQFDEMRNTRSSKATMRELRQGGKGALINKIVNPVRSMEDLIGITEKATRFQNFKGIYEAEMKRSGNEKIATQKASQAALQNSVNFTRAGKAMRVINLLLPYSNAGIQGSRNVARSFRKRPVATTMKSVAFVAVPTVLLTLMNYDDEETAKVYKNIDDTEKDDNFIIVLKGAKQNEAGSYEGIIKIPKPQGYRELTNPLRIAAERFAGNEKSGDVSKMVRDAMSAFTGPVSIEDSGKFISSLIPQAVKPTLQAIENKDYYWDSQTVPDYMIDGTDDPTKRAYKSTSGTARIIADQLGVSPILVEKFIQDTAGSVGRYGINLTDRGLNKLGIVKDDQIGGKTITGDFKRRTTEARAIEKTNKTDGQRYYDNVEKATGELPKYLQDSWKSYNTSDKNFLGEVLFEKNGQAKKQAKAAAYIEHPELFEVDKKLDKLNRKKGETGNPLYDLSYNQALIVVQEKALPPGAKDEGLNALYDQQWYSQYKNKEEKYYDKIFGKGGIEENKDNPYPERSPDLISAMDSYYDLPSSYAKGAWKKANPGIASQMEAYYSAKDAWTNTERAKLGLPPIEDRYAKYESSSGKSGSSGGSRGRSRRGSSGGSSGSRKGKFDYKFGAFAPSEIGSKKSLRKILEEAQL